MTDIATMVIVGGKRVADHQLRIECPFCKHRNGRWRRRKSRFHYHGIGGGRGIYRGHRLAHRDPNDLPPQFKDKSLGYIISRTPT